MGLSLVTSTLSPTMAASSMCTPTTWPSTMAWVPGPPSGPGSSIVRQYLHSKATGDSATRGGATSLDGAGVSPASTISSTSGATCSEVDEMELAGLTPAPSK